MLQDESLLQLPREERTLYRNWVFRMPQENADTAALLLKLVSDRGQEEPLAVIKLPLCELVSDGRLKNPPAEF